MKKQWKYYDYCHDPYLPIQPLRGKFQSDVVLRNSLLHNDYQKSFLSIIKMVREAIGPRNTVWDVKLDRGKMAWEFYFYNYRDKDPRRGVTSLLKVFRRYFKVPVFKDIGIEFQPYFMFSLDLSEDILKSKQIEGIHLYTIGRAGASGGNSYYWNKEGISLENRYDFFQMPQEAPQFIYKIKQSIVLAQNHENFLKHRLVKQLMPCHKICVANKKYNDGVYFSRVKVDQLLSFLEHFTYPEHMVDFIRTHQNKLDHLLYDVAFDCTFGPKGPVFSKSSFYSVF